MADAEPERDTIPDDAAQRTTRETVGESFTFSSERIDAGALPPTFTLSIVAAWGIAVLFGLGGIAALVSNAFSPAEVQVFGNKVSIGIVGVACLFIAIVARGLMIWAAYKATAALRNIPPEKPENGVRHDSPQSQN